MGYWTVAQLVLNRTSLALHTLALPIDGAAARQAIIAEL